MKNTLKLALIIFVAWLWLPTSPTDFLFIPWIIALIGMNMYILISMGLVIYLYCTIEGKTLKDKIKNAVKGVKKLL